jgi:hypothetical protein
VKEAPKKVNVKVKTNGRDKAWTSKSGLCDDAEEDGKGENPTDDDEQDESK